MTSLRTKELIGTIVVGACDIVEANSSAVAVEDAAAVADAVAVEALRCFQAHFEEGVASDACMAKSGEGHHSLFGKFISRPFQLWMS